MKIKLAILSLSCICFLLTSGNIYAKTKELNVKGYQVELNYAMLGKKRTKNLRAWGSVKGGKKCEKLKMTMFFECVDHSELVRIITVIRDYSPYGRDFRGEEEKYVHSSPHDFELEDLYIDCY